MEIRRAMTKLQETYHALRRRLERTVGRHRITPRHLAKRMERGESYIPATRLTIRCYDCGHPVYANDDANVCIQCGGQSRRVTHNYN